MQRCIKCDWCDTCDECSAPDRCQRQRVLSPTLSPSLLHSPYYWNIGRILYVSMLHHHEYPSQGTSLVRLQVARYVVGMPPGHKVCRWYTSRSQGTSLVCLQIARYVVRHTSCSSAYVFSRQALGLRFHCPTHLTLSLYPLATHPVPWRGMTFARRLSIEMGMDQMLGETPGARFLLAGTYFSASVSVSLSLCPLSHNTIG